MFVKGAKFPKWGPNFLGNLAPRGPYFLGNLARGGQIFGGAKFPVTPALYFILNKTPAEAFTPPADEK